MSGNENIVLDSAELLTQGAALKTLRDEYDAMFTQVTSILNELNEGWSENLANNFVGKISAAQKGFAKIIEMLECGETVAKEAATSFDDVNAVMARQISGAFSNLFENISGGNLSGLIGTGVNLDLIKNAWEKIDPFKDGGLEAYRESISNVLKNATSGNYGEILSQLEGELFGTDYISKTSDTLSVIKDYFTGDMDSESIEKLSGLLDLEAIGEKIGFSDGTGMSIITEGLKNYFDPENPVTLDYLEDMENVADAWNDGNYFEAITGGFFHTLEGSTKIVTDVVVDGFKGTVDTVLEQTGLDNVIDSVPWGDINDKLTEATGIDFDYVISNVGKEMSNEFSNRIDETIEGIPIVVDYVGEQISDGIQYVGDMFENAGSAISDWFGW